MSLDKSIKHRKDKRQPYRGSARFDRSCRHGGSCDYCRNARLRHDARERAEASEQLSDLSQGTHPMDIDYSAHTTAPLTDADREFWIGHDPAIYAWWAASGQRVCEFIATNRRELDGRIARAPGFAA